MKCKCKQNYPNSYGMYIIGETYPYEIVCKSINIGDRFYFSGTMKVDIGVHYTLFDEMLFNDLFDIIEEEETWEDISDEMFM